MEGWTLLSTDRQTVPHELRAEAQLLHADLRHVPEAVTELYWQAPPSYLGDRVSRHIGPKRGDLCPRRPGGDYERAQAPPPPNASRAPDPRW